VSPSAKLGDVMSRPVQVAMPGQRLAEIEAFFTAQSGLPVVDDEGRCVGVVSKKDRAKVPMGSVRCSFAACFSFLAVGDF
jgi:CBS-domain-containing membrane protein